MDFLKEWVRSLVLLVLLAGSLELLLPMNSMKKYVRMTMGLLIVLSISRPLLSFVGRPVSLDAAAIGDEGSGRLPTVDQIVAKAGEFRDKSRDLALAEARDRLAAEAVQAAKAVKGVADAQATVDLEQKGTDLAVRQVTVTLQPARSGSLMEPVKPVAPVRVGPGEGGSPPEAPPLTESERALADAVRREVAARLGIPAESQMIRVLVGGGR